VERRAPRRVEDRVVPRRLQESPEVLDRRDHAAVADERPTDRIPVAGRVVADGAGTAAVRDVLALPALVAVEAGARHLRGLEDLLTEVLRVGLARDLFDDRGEDRVAGVGVPEPRVRREAQRFAEDARERRVLRELREVPALARPVDVFGETGAV